MATSVLAIMGTPAYLLFNMDGLIFILGIVAAYLIYEWFHYSHHVHPGSTRYGRRMRRHHFHHHFVNPRSNHGVTSPFWDLIFRTYEAPSKIRVPVKLQMKWLSDSESGEVFPQHSKWYELKGRRT